MRAALLCLILSACALLPEQPSHSPMAIFDAYLIAHGMAQSYSMRADADPAVTTQLATLDMRARHALVDLAPNGDPERTARAVAELSDYAARQTSTAH